MRPGGRPGIGQVGRPARRRHTQGTDLCGSLLGRAGRTVVVDEDVDAASCESERKRTAHPDGATGHERVPAGEIHDTHPIAPSGRESGSLCTPKLSLRSVSRVDPKPGRWILPLVVAGILGFTYTFVNALTAADGDATVTTTLSATTTTSTTSTSVAPTTTTLPPELAAFIDAIAELSTEASAFAERATQLNEDWDARTIKFSEVRSGLGDLRGSTADFNEAVAAVEVPEDATEAWVAVAEAAAEMRSAADNMLDGLVNSAGSERRLGALEDYTIAEATLQRALSTAESAAGG